MNVFKKLLSLAAALALAHALPAQSLPSSAVGYLPAAISAGTGTTAADTVLSLPLSIPTGASWKSEGRITALTATTLTDASKDWTAGQWSEPATPWFIRITSGASAGRNFLLSTTVSNSATTLTLDASETDDLTTLGIATGDAGDTYVIFAADTLAVLFPPESGVLGGASAAVADNIQINRGGVWSTYYYNTTAGHWVEATSGADASNTVIPPDCAFLYIRLANTPINLTLAGSVQGGDRRASIQNGGFTFLSNAWPVPVTLANSGIQNLPGWVSSSSSASADQVQILVSGVWKKYFYSGTNWRQITLGNPIRDSDVIPAGAGVLINRVGSATGSTVLHQTQP